VTNDLDTVRRWVGTPEALMERPEFVDPIRRFPELAAIGASDVRTHARRRRATTGGAEAARAAFANITPQALAGSVSRFKAAEGPDRKTAVPSSEALDVLRAAAYTHVRGNKTLVADYKTAVEAFFVEFEIAAWLFTEIRVQANSVLQFGEGANVCKAYSVVLEPGAKIRSFGHLTVDCTRLRRESGGVVGTLPGHVRPRPVLDIRRPMDPPLFG
jgi:hypothetical protein